MKNTGMFKRLNLRCVVEGQQEEMYLRHLASLINDPPRKVVTFKTTIGQPKDLIREYFDYDFACIFDYDNNKKRFEDNVKICMQLDKNKSKYKEHMYLAYTNICFDLWLLLHKKYFDGRVTNNDDYIDKIIKEYGLPKGTDIKSHDAMESILKQITLEDVESAIRNAERIRASKEFEMPHYVGNVKYYDNPDMTIDRFVKYVLEEMDCVA